MNNETEKDFNLGGSIDTALSGQYELSITKVFKEAWDCTIQHFLSFSPAIILLAILQIAIFFIALHFQVSNVTGIFENFAKNGTFPDGFMRSLYIANFSYEVVSAPFYAGVSLMAMSHAAGLSTTTKQIGSGLQYTVSVIIVTLVSLVLQGVANLLLPVISLYLSLAFTNASLLVCEKRVRPFTALWLSLRAANRKLLQLSVIYAVIMGLFLAALMFYGIGLVLVLPFFFHVKGIIYRNMFGVRLKVVATNHDDDNDNSDGGESDNDKPSQVFNA
ncbi:hypothetical protein [Vibrio palustris]|uniref:Proline and glycine rich transmembrane protein n=1 Tax=Vibrio palustris TaxID=1918946 RepID=A0A1R4B2H1_9VIBR|nr:hypothetical protein [Vibrio palustris]SJL83120.1 hypothetical protein VPAL9027_01069 [Vibrio palustris]